jgi:hypothetical protein
MTDRWVAVLIAIYRSTTELPLRFMMHKCNVNLSRQISIIANANEGETSRHLPGDGTDCVHHMRSREKAVIDSLPIMIGFCWVRSSC